MCASFPSFININTHVNSQAHSAKLLEEHKLSAIIGMINIIYLFI